MIRKVSLFAEIARPMGLEPAVLDRLGGFNVLVGPNGSGKSRLLGLVRLMFELAPRTDEIRTLLSHKLSAAEKPAERERLERGLGFIDALARPDAILVDGEQGLRRPSQEDRCVDLTYGSDFAAEVTAATLPDLPRSTGAVSFASAHRAAPAFLQKIARALFNGRHPDLARRPDVAEALREAERFNRIAASLLGKEVTPEVSLADGFEITANLGGRRFQAAELSSGEGLLVTWAILLHEQAPSLQEAVVVIDEPELHLHPSLQQGVLSSLRAALGDHGQLWVVTHSPTIAERPDVTNLLLLERGVIRPLSHRPSKADERELGLEVNKPPLVLPSPSASKAPVGVSDFRKIIESDSLIYVDKTQFIEDVLRNPAEVLLFPRPRRFGKSLNLSALRYFVEKNPESQQRATWFKDLRVWKSSEARRHFGRYPVIYLTLKEAKAASFSSLLRKVGNIFSDLYEEHRYLLDEGSLSSSERPLYEKILWEEGEREDYESALKRLSRHLWDHHKERVMILVDEYDAPLHEAYEHGYLDEASRFFGNFFSAGLKENPHLWKGVLSGVLRIARESLFSDLNNLSVYSILRPEFATHFGFTEGEVQALCRRLGAPGLMSGLREWYNGYLFGNQVLFNPWSVLCCLDSDDKRLDPYWAKTSSSKLLRKQLFEKEGALGGELSALLRGEPIHKPIDENLVLRTLDSTPDALWSLALFSGYLKPAEPLHGADPRSISLTIPNLEVRRELEALVREYFSKPAGGANNAERMWGALVNGNDKEFEAYLNEILTYNMSPYDKDSRTPERGYQMLLLGMLVFLPSHEVLSNHVAGHGRYDLMLIPRAEGRPGVCLELKVSEGNVEKALTEALRQIDERRYTVELERRGAHPIHKIAVVFEGQQAWVRRGQEPAASSPT